MKYLISEDEDIAKAYREYEYFSQDEELRELYEARMKWERDYATNIEAARNAGLEEGMAKGIEKGRLEVALNMLKAGIPMEEVASLTSLPVDVIQALIKKITH